MSSGRMSTVKKPDEVIGRERYHVVRCGRRPSAYLSWTKCRKQVDGFRGAEHRVFKVLAEAEEFVSEV
ncbi:uncharacterized protein [Physcomitrium patens]|uniref:Ribonuclease H1 N-terminal domain-containing protein n=1 Tax=Physcomitrium patens TaxID=3218 RepID=A0A2K1K8H1_PHYPA|nr:hypothetical protein PHYPA_011970 [Physcomitrium patens]